MWRCLYLNAIILSLCRFWSHLYVVTLRHRPSCTLTSLLVQHNQSPDAGIFALFPGDSEVEKEDNHRKTVVSDEAAGAQEAVKLRNSALLLSLHPLKLNSPNMVKHAGRAQLNLQLTRALCSPSPNYVFITAGERHTHTFKGTFLQLIPCKFKLKHLPAAGHLHPAVLCFSFIFFM